MTTVQLPARPASAALVRRHLAQELIASEIASSVTDDAMLIVSELITNSIRHARPLPDGSVTVAWSVSDDGVTLRVTDGGAEGRPRPRTPGPEETSGRGLALVEALAARWGIEDSADSTTVWAQLSL